MIKPRHWHTIDGMRVTCQGGEPCPNPYWEHPLLEGDPPAAEESDEADERTDFDLIHRKLDHAISAAFFCGGMFGLLIAVALFAIAVLKR